MFWKKLRKLMIKLGIAGLGFFAVTFVVYFFNLDMKLTSVMEGFMLKHYDKIDRRPAPVNARIKPDASVGLLLFRRNSVTSSKCIIDLAARTAV